ncbi:MAG: hypothetical protein BWY66_01428 [bacterium ADurb.Bin374]|nr:MAG: hypothetical protein BWY66_01428 [bacterium ADurb.Bin374]
MNERGLVIRLVELFEGLLGGLPDESFRLEFDGARADEQQQTQRRQADEQQQEAK